jgi:hypothetical protein
MPIRPGFPNTILQPTQPQGWAESLLRTFPPLRSIPMPNFNEISPVVWISIGDTHTHTQTQIHTHIAAVNFGNGLLSCPISGRDLGLS